MSDGARPALIFLHIPKTAGLTLRHVLRAQYRPAETYVPRLRQEASAKTYARWLITGDNPPEPVPGGRNRAYEEQLRALGPERLGRLRVLYGHFWFGLHESVPAPSVYMTLLRDPVDRVLSLYHHRATRHGLTMPIEEYVETGRDFQMDNSQTRRLAARTGEDNLFEPATPAMLERAATNLDSHVAVAGLTERFDESLLLMARTFGWRDPTYVSWNVSSGRPRAEALEPRVLEGIERRNRLDRELYTLVSRRFDDALRATLADPAGELAAFRRRNARYQRFAPRVQRLRQAAATVLGRRSRSAEEAAS